eukprot:scaffold10.g2416.t1
MQRVCAAAGAAQEDEVMIRRRPPHGVAKQPCGPVDFEVPVPEDNAPRNILEEIVWYKAVEVEAFRSKVPLPALIKAAQAYPEPTRDFIGAIRAAAERTGRPGLIAEVKKASPSRGVIQPNFDPVAIAKSYERGGAACLRRGRSSGCTGGKRGGGQAASGGAGGWDGPPVLTDTKFFQGSFENLGLIRGAGVGCPLLCKEFIVEPYQVYKARASGADAILLIAAVLPSSDLSYLLKVARGVGLQCLIEVHTTRELERVLRLGNELEGCMLGINNRDLQTFKVDLRNTGEIMGSEAGREFARRGLLMAGESGIFTPADVAYVQGAGCGAILVGESIVREGNPETAVRQLLA